MKIKILHCVSLFALAMPSVLLLRAEEPIIPPSLAKIWPVGMERGSTATFTLEGRNLSGAKAVIFDAPGITAKISQITDLPEEMAERKFSTAAAVPLAKKQSALLEITVAKDVPPDVYRFRVQTPLGTTNMLPLAIGSLPEVKKSEKSGNTTLHSQRCCPRLWWARLQRRETVIVTNSTARLGKMWYLR